MKRIALDLLTIAAGFVGGVLSLAAAGMPC